MSGKLEKTQKNKKDNTKKDEQKMIETVMFLFNKGYTIDDIAVQMEENIEEINRIIIKLETYNLEPVYEQLKPGECYILKILGNSQGYKMIYISHKKPGVLTLETAKLKKIK